MRLLRGAGWAAALLPWSMAASAQPVPSGAGTDTTGTLGTHAQAHRRLPNTVSDVSVGIEVHARDLPAAAALLSTRSRTLLGYLQGAKAERVRTEQVGVDPDTESVRDQPDRITGYAGHATVSFRTTPDALAALLAGCLDHGANALQGVQATPRESEIETARQELGAEATRTALAEATRVAAAVGARVAGIAQIDVDPTEGGGMRPMMAFAMQKSPRATPPIPTEAGESDISVNVVLRVRIRPAP